VLRTIGQELVTRGIDLFELRCLRTEYNIQCGDPQPPHTNLLNLRFTPDAIISMDLAAAARRSEAFTVVDFEALPEILRALGGYVDDKEGNLIRISHAELMQPPDTIRVEYEGRDGRIYLEDLPRSTIADNAMRMYKIRMQNRPNPAWHH